MCELTSLPAKPFARPFAVMVVLAVLSPVTAAAQQRKNEPIGVQGEIGCHANPKRTGKLIITRSGTYENFLVDGAWVDRNLVRINADNVTLRHCEIRNGMHNGIVVTGRDVLIESCRIHHFLKGTFDKQADAHGITGHPDRLMIRNCEIYLVSGDAVQFDPDRNEWGDVIIDNCTFWTAPLEEDAAGFSIGERPGENALDTKQLARNPRSRIVLRNSFFHGWGNGQLEVQSALNLKENIHVAVSNCVLNDNDIGFRVRGDFDTGPRGGALVKIENCAVFNTKVAVRMENKIKNLTIRNLGIGQNVDTKYTRAGGGTGVNYKNVGEFKALPMEKLLKTGVRR